MIPIKLYYCEVLYMDSFVIFAFSHIIECIIAYYYYSNLFSARKGKSFQILAFIAAYTLLFLFMLVNPPYLNIPLYIIINFILTNILFCSQKRTLLFHSFFLTAIMACSELVANLIPHSFMYNFDEPEINTEVIFCFILSKVLYAFFIIAFVHIRKSKQNDSHIAIPFYLVMILTGSLIVVFILAYLMVNIPMGRLSEYLIAVALTTTIIMDFVVMWLKDYIQKKQDKLTKMELALQQEQNARNYFYAIQDQDINQKILLHDIKNHIMVVENLCANGKSLEASQYLKQLLDSPALSQNVRPTTNDNLNIILNVYIKRCESKNIRFTIDFDCYVDFMDISHLTSLFCNLLDNAVEAAVGCDNPFIALILRYDEAARTARISMTNSCMSEPKKDKNNSYYSSKRKDKKHGFGLSSIKRIVELYSGNLYTYYENDTATFHSVIMLTSREGN